MQIEKIKKEIVQKLNIEALPAKDQEKLIDQVSEAIISRIIYKTMEKLSGNELEEFKTIIENESFGANEVYVFLKRNIENYDEFLDNIVNEFFRDLEKYEQEDGLKTNPEHKDSSN